MFNNLKFYLNIIVIYLFSLYLTMKLYKIADLEHLSGIKAHTIRIWEKRYNLIEPIRTDTNYRRYNDDQVKKLLNVTTLLSKGYKISQLAELKEREINEKILEIQQDSNEDTTVVSYVNALASAMINFDEATFNNTLNKVIERFGMYEAMVKVIYPLLYKIGVMWAVDNAMPVQEHFASCIIKRKLSAAIETLGPAERKDKKFLLFLPPDEYHEIALLFTNYIIKAKGYETIYLGQNVPYENIKEVVKITQPNYLITFLIAGHDEVAVNELKNNLKLSKSLTLLVSGNSDVLAQLKKIPHAEVLNSPGDLVKFL